MPRLAREEVDIIASLRNILDNYPAGEATLREILQNTDDAGAKTQTFILDTRTFDSTSLVDSKLAICQGPAVIAANDAYFEDKDWKAITKILNSSKTQDETSTGKYGLGFRSCYHITDNPHILSSDKLLILDPHGRVEKFQGGFDLNTKRAPNEENEIEREAYKDHFATFSAVLKPDDDVYSGTAIRLPLRLPGFQSRLKSTSTRVEDARNMFNDFIAKELPEAMLFLKHITGINIKEIGEDGVETVLATATLERADTVAPQRSGDRVKQQETSHHHVTITLQIGSALPFARKWIITHFVEKYETASDHMARRLRRPQNDVEENMVKDKLVPHVALALPISQDDAVATPDFHGRLFTLLPLPIITNFPVHINAVFALLSSRQHLRNSMDAEAGSRDEFLVEWNRVIFSEFVSRAWAALLDYLVALSSADSSVQPCSTINVSEAWPGPVASQDGDQGYWYSLPSRLLEEAAHKAVWPLHGKRSQFSALVDVLVEEKGERVAPLGALEACNVRLVVVPQRVFILIKTSAFKKTILSPESSYPYIKKNSGILSDLDAPARKLICDYLASANDIRLIFDLPIIPQVRDKYTSITSHGKKHVLANKSEASIFGDVDQNLLHGKFMSDATKKLLLSDPTKRVRLIGPADIARYVEILVPRSSWRPSANLPTRAEPETIEWLIRFWKWLDGWERFEELAEDSGFWSKIRGLYALPIRLSDGNSGLRLAGKSAVRPGDVNPALVKALVALEIPVLEVSMSAGKAVQQVSKDHHEVTFILQSLPKDKAFTHLDQTSRQTLYNFFTKELPNHLLAGSRFRHQVPLSAESRSALRTLPIFPIINPGRRDNNNITFDVAPEGAYFVDDSVEIIPNIPGTPFINNGQGGFLHTAFEGRGILGEIDVLRKVINPDVWSQQDCVPGLLPALVDRLIKRLSELGAATRERIAELAIVEVGGRAGRQSPKEVVDPSSGLAELYDVEDGVLPVGEFAKDGPGTYISQLRSCEMIRTALTPPTIEERVARISNQSQPMKDRAKKALHLLKLLESYPRPSVPPTDTIKILVSSAWLPVGNAFYRPSECWDGRSKDALLCDLVLPRLQISVTSSHLREWLGWTRVPFATLKAQLLKVVMINPRSSETSRLDKIEALLRELATELKANRIPRKDIGLLAGALGDAAWVPTASRSRCAARQALLETIDLGKKYHPVAPSIRSAAMEVLLKQMGINRRPNKASLFETLQEISTELSEPDIEVQLRAELVQTSILILEELRRTMEGSKSEFQKILIPTEACQLVPAPEVLFNDMDRDPTSPPPGLQFAHSKVSSSLSNALSLRRLSEEEFSQGDDGIQSFHMAEDVTIRIRGVLQGYDIDHPSNEWIAKADDAGARSVRFLVDEANFDGRRVISGLNSFQSGPALVAHNDGIFTDADFQGLLAIGQGGKSGKADSIGRFGLGALYFSELPWVISGKYCLFMDPSLQFLPRERGNIRRSAALVPLSLCIKRYPDQLKPLEDLFGFSLRNDYYNGTLFRFPLRTATQAASSKLSDKHFSAIDITNKINHFYTYARQSFFFTKSLEEISASRRTADGRVIPMWSVRSSCEKLSKGVQSHIIVSRLSLHLKAPDATSEVPEDWLVTTSEVAKEDFPKAFQPLFTQHRLPPPAFGLAMNLSAEASTPNPRLFAALPLPVPISLPVHIHASWILAHDRRSIRYDVPNTASQKPLDILYNEHILKREIAPLYVKTLAFVLQHHPKSIRHFWPGKAQDGPSRVVVTELHRLIVSTQESILLSANDQPISPSKAIIHLSKKAPVAVRKTLTELKIPNYVPVPYFDTSVLKDWGSLRFDSAKEVSKILRERATAVKKLWQDTDHTNPSDAALTPKDLMSILDYLAKEGDSLDGIPLLLRGDHQLVEFRSEGHSKIFASHREELSDLFGACAVVGLALSDGEARSLVKHNVNVGTLDAQGMRDLLTHHINAIAPANVKVIKNTDRGWYSKLLKLLTSSGCPVQLEHLEDLPLLPAVDRDLVVSLRYATSGKIWWRFPNEDQALTTTLHQLGVTAVDILPGGTQRVEASNLARILRLFGQWGFSSAQVLQKVTPNDWDAFVDYIKLRINGLQIEKLSTAEFQILMELPFFSGRQGTNRLPFVSASQVLMLPDSVPLDALARYLPSGSVFAEYSPDLAAILRRGQHSRNLSFANLLDRLRIPNQLSPDDDASFFSFLRLVATHHLGHYNNQLIPDGNRILRRPSELFDHRVALFSTAFEGRDQLFVHPNFRNLIDRLVGLGVQREITSERLLECIQAVDHDAAQGQDPVNRARWFWSYLNTAPPQLREIEFDTLRGLRFLPRQTQRHPYDSRFDGYARDLPNVVSLDDLCAPDHDLAAWTQRARFVTSPSAHLKAVYEDMGEPTASDVVQHLLCLVTHVAPNHHQSSIVLDDIRKVYGCLMDNADHVKGQLQQLVRQPLWLNVNSGQDDWTWCTADELVFGLTFDGSGHFVVREFLRPYQSLLLDIGAHEFRAASPPPPETSTTNIPHPEMIRSGWNGLRKTGRLLDICFKVQGQEIQAHRGMLAAMIPHFDVAFAGPFRESIASADDAELPVYRLPEEAASAFAVKSVVDYVYTGTFEYPTFFNRDEADAALDDLLDLMELSDLWDVSELANQAVQAIVKLNLIRIDNFDDVLARADACQMTALIDVCRKTKERNRWA
ncbi:hypothetical protein FRC05_009845 [Tulasnella sp. 425]|nr:hypothetical protein FRC05_009845 [Tulasnella sp. 425]